MRTRCFTGAASLLGALLALAGCTGGSKTGVVSGAVTVDGQTPAAGSSISFFPSDGKAATAGALLEDGKYTVRVPVGTAKVEIRVPRAVSGAKGEAAGPGPGGDRIEESLPARYNDNTELTYEVKPGRQEKNWELKTR